MSKVIVWKSDADGKLFEDQKKYVAHLRKLARGRAHTRKISKMNAARAELLTRTGQVESAMELEQFVRDNWNWFYLNGLTRRWGTKREQATEPHQLISFRLEVKWDDCVSNSHSCPRDGVTNWGGRDAVAPRGYPGWRGHLYLKVLTPEYTYCRAKYRQDGFGSDYFTNTGINTGSGGGGGRDTDGVTSYTYGVELFASDFPGMKLGRDRAYVWNQVSGHKREFV